MALTLRRSRPRGSVGLDLDGCFIAAVQLDGGRITRAASAALEPGIVRDGEVADEHALGEALRRFFKEEGLPANVRLGVANQQVAVRELELPRIEFEEERDAAVRFLAADAIAMPLEEAVLDYQVVGEAVSPEGGVRDRVVVAAARAAMIDRVVGAVRAAGLRPEGIDLSAFALVRALGGPDAEPADAARAICHLGGVTNLAIAVGRSCIFTRPLAVSMIAAPSEDRPAPERVEAGLPRDAGVEGSVEGPAVTAAPEAAPPGGEAAPYAPGAPGAPAERPDAVLEAGADQAEPAAGGETEQKRHVAALAEEIRLSIDFYMGQPDARWVRDLVLSGPGSTHPGLAEDLAEATGLPVSVAEPLGGLDSSGLPVGEDPHRHTVAAGLALGGAA